jgi:hypothetical protein
MSHLNPRDPLREPCLVVTLALSAVFLATSCNKPAAPEQKAAPAKPAASVPDLKVSPAILAKAQNPKPGPHAVISKQRPDTFGKGKASVTVKGHPGGVDHSFWTEEIDVDGSGNPVQVDEAWDNHHKVLYISKDRTFTCRNGQTGDGSTLMVVYSPGNTLDKPAGSGWWISELDAAECGVAEAGVYGCRFDASGNNTDCGSATVKSEDDDVVIIPLPAAPAQPNSGQ